MVFYSSSRINHFIYCFPVTIGGGGSLGLSNQSPMLGKKHSEKTKKILSEKRKLMKGIFKHSRETKLKMSLAQIGSKNHMYGKKASVETINKMINSRTGVKNHNARKIIQYSLNGEFIREWGCIMDAVRELNISRNISACCLGQLKTSGGYIWRYKIMP